MNPLFPLLRPTAALFLGLLLFGCGTRTDDSSDTQADRRAIPIETAAAERGSIDDPVQATGTIRPAREVVVAFQGAGPVMQIDAHLGDRVRRGHRIARVDSRSQRAQMDQARSQLRSTEAALQGAVRHLERLEALHQGWASSEASLEEAQLREQSARSQFESAEAAVVLAEQAVGHTRIRAPWTGRVAESWLEVGGLVSPGQPAVRLVDVERVEVTVGVPTHQVARVEPGQRVLVRIANLPGRVFEGKVHRVGPDSDPRTRSFPVELVLPNPDGDLRPGMVARVDIVVASRSDAVLVPDDAVVEGSPPVIFVIELERAQRREVVLGHARDGLVEVREGVNAGERVATLGRQHLSDGDPVTVYRIPASSSPDAETAPAAPQEEASTGDGSGG